jgi:hypothetical protein
VTRLGLPAGHKAAAAHGTHSGNVAEPRVRARFFDIGLVVIAIAVLVGVSYAPAPSSSASSACGCCLRSPSPRSA